jgi:acyl-coenzyme A thioesterase PaaI-like protein
MPFDIDMTWTLEPPGLVATFTPGPHHHGPADHLHGGIAAMCLDECMAALGHSLDGIHTVTGTLNIRYRKPVPLDGRAVRVESWREGDGRRATKVFGRIVTADGDVAVEAHGLFVRVPEDAYPPRKKSQ